MKESEEKMTKREAIESIKYRIKTASEIVGKGEDGKAFEDLEMAIKALKELIAMEENKGNASDLIRRKDVIEMIKDEKTFVDGEAYHSLRNVEEYVCGLSAAYDVEKVITELEEYCFEDSCGDAVLMYDAEPIIRNGGKRYE